MTRLHKEVIRTIRQLTRQIKIDNKVISISAYVEVAQLDKKKDPLVKKDIMQWTEEDLMCFKLANKCS